MVWRMRMDDDEFTVQEDENDEPTPAHAPTPWHRHPSPHFVAATTAELK